MNKTETEGRKTMDRNYVYYDEQKNPVFRKTYTENGDSFFQQYSDGGEWTDSSGEEPIMLYNLPGLTQLKEGDNVYLFSTEEEADRLMQEGSEYNLVAVANPEGAGEWQNEYNEYFRNLNIAICIANNEQSEKHAEAVAGKPHETAASVKVISPSSAPDGDLGDFLDAGNSIRDFLREAEETALWQPSEESLECSCTDTGNAERMSLLLNGKAKWCKAFGWTWWDGTKWLLDQDEELLFETKKIFRSLRAEAASIKNTGDETKKRKDKLLSWAEKSEDCLKRQRALTLLKSEPTIRTSAECFDGNRYLLNVENQLLDLSRLKNGGDPAVTRKKECMITHKLSVLYEPGAECPRWERFIREIFDGDEEIIKFVQKMAGYSLTGETREQCVFILHGSGRNGKSTMLNVFDAIMGKLSRSAAVETFCTDRGNKIPEDRAALRDARMVKTSEVVDKQHTLDLGFIKDATGGEMLSGRFLYKNTFEYDPQFKVMMACNVKPKIPNMDYGTWRRIRLIPFNVKFSGKNDNRNLKNELLAEKAGVLNWMLEGCRKWQQEGLEPPKSIRAATEAYKNDADSMGGFFEDYIDCGDGLEERAKDLHAEYERYCRSCNQEIMSTTAFGRSLSERGFSKKHTRDGVVWQGLSLKQC